MRGVALFRVEPLTAPFYQGVGGIGPEVLAIHGVGGIGPEVFTANQGVGGMGPEVLANVCVATL
jgi:hypothetical protein